MLGSKLLFNWLHISIHIFEPCFTGPPALTVNIMKNTESSSIVVQWDEVDDFLPTTYSVTWTSEIDHIVQVKTLIEQSSYTITGLTLDTVYTILLLLLTNVVVDQKIVLVFHLPDTTSTSSLAASVSTNTMNIGTINTTAATINTSSATIMTTAAMIKTKLSTFTASSTTTLGDNTDTTTTTTTETTNLKATIMSTSMMTSDNTYPNTTMATTVAVKTSNTAVIITSTAVRDLATTDTVSSIPTITTLDISGGTNSQLPTVATHN